MQHVRIPTTCSSWALCCCSTRQRVHEDSTQHLSSCNHFRLTICPQVDSKHGGELCERELHGDSISHCAQHRTNGRQRPARNLGRAADYAGDCYCNPLTDPYALRDCYYALSRLLLPVASRWPLDFWQKKGDFFCRSCRLLAPRSRRAAYAAILPCDKIPVGC